MTRALIIAGAVAILIAFGLNSCSCQNAFNNGYCPWRETWLGGSK